MRPIATHDVVCLSACVQGTPVSLAGVVEPIKMTFEVANLRGAKEPGIQQGSSFPRVAGGGLSEKPVCRSSVRWKVRGDSVAQDDEGAPEGVAYIELDCVY